jgi:hypothetical protein
MVYVIKGNRRSLCLNKKLRGAINAEIIVRSFCCLRGKLYNDISVVWGLLRLIFYVPAEGIEEWVYEIEPYLRLRIAFGEIIVPVLLEF